MAAAVICLLLRVTFIVEQASLRLVATSHRKWARPWLLSSHYCVCVRTISKHKTYGFGSVLSPASYIEYPCVSLVSGHISFPNRIISHVFRVRRTCSGGFRSNFLAAAYIVLVITHEHCKNVLTSLKVFHSLLQACRNFVLCDSWNTFLS